jgi:hypothetical protein
MVETQIFASPRRLNFHTYADKFSPVYKFIFSCMQIYFLPYANLSGYVCKFTGVPAALFRVPEQPGTGYAND